MIVGPPAPTPRAPRTAPLPPRRAPAGRGPLPRPPLHPTHGSTPAPTGRHHLERPPRAAVHRDLARPCVPRRRARLRPAAELVSIAATPVRSIAHTARDDSFAAAPFGGCTITARRSSHLSQTTRISQVEPSRCGRAHASGATTRGGSNREPPSAGTSADVAQWCLREPRRVRGRRGSSPVWPPT